MGKAWLFLQLLLFIHYGSCIDLLEINLIDDTILLTSDDSTNDFFSLLDVDAIDYRKQLSIQVSNNTLNDIGLEFSNTDSMYEVTIFYEDKTIYSLNSDLIFYVNKNMKQKIIHDLPPHSKIMQSNIFNVTDYDCSSFLIYQTYFISVCNTRKEEKLSKKAQSCNDCILEIGSMSTIESYTCICNDTFTFFIQVDTLFSNSYIAAPSIEFVNSLGNFFDIRFSNTTLQAQNINISNNAIVNFESGVLDYENLIIFGISNTIDDPGVQLRNVLHIGAFYEKRQMNIYGTSSYSSGIHIEVNCTGTLNLGGIHLEGTTDSGNSGIVIGSPVADDCILKLEKPSTIIGNGGLFATLEIDPSLNINETTLNINLVSNCTNIEFNGSSLEITNSIITINTTTIFSNSSEPCGDRSSNSVLKLIEVDEGGPVQQFTFKDSEVFFDFFSDIIIPRAPYYGLLLFVDFSANSSDFYIQGEIVFDGDNPEVGVNGINLQLIDSTIDIESEIFINMDIYSNQNTNSVKLQGADLTNINIDANVYCTGITGCTAISVLNVKFEGNCSLEGSTTAIRENSAVVMEGYVTVREQSTLLVYGNVTYNVSCTDCDVDSYAGILIVDDIELKPDSFIELIGFNVKNETGVFIDGNINPNDEPSTTIEIYGGGSLYGTHLVNSIAADVIYIEGTSSAIGIMLDVNGEIRYKDLTLFGDGDVIDIQVNNNFYFTQTEGGNNYVMDITSDISFTNDFLLYQYYDFSEIHFNGQVNFPTTLTIDFENDLGNQLFFHNVSMSGEQAIIESPVTVTGNLSCISITFEKEINIMDTFTVHSDYIIFHEINSVDMGSHGIYITSDNIELNSNVCINFLSIFFLLFIIHNNFD